jgi:hypothetical protein
MAKNQLYKGVTDGEDRIDQMMNWEKTGIPTQAEVDYSGLIDGGATNEIDLEVGMDEVTTDYPNTASLDGSANGNMFGPQGGSEVAKVIDAAYADCGPDNSILTRTTFYPDIDKTEGFFDGGESTTMKGIGVTLNQGVIK